MVVLPIFCKRSGPPVFLYQLRLNLLAITLAFLSRQTRAFNPYDDSSVVVLSDQNFTEVVEREPHIVVEFYAPWCRYCQRLLPEYNAAAKTLRGRVPLAKVDGTQHTELMSKFGLDSYPTILLMQGGREQARYPGTPSFERELVEWVDEKTRALIEEVTEAPTWYALGKPNVVLYTPSTGEGAARRWLDALAKKYAKQAYFFHITTDSESKEKVTVSVKPEKVSQFIVGVDGGKQEFVKFVKSSWKANAVATLNGGNFAGFLKETRYVLVAFVDPSCPHCKALAPEYKNAAAALRGEPFKLARVDASKEAALARAFKIDGYPTMLWFVNGVMAQKYNGRRSQGGIVEWVHEQVLPAVTRAEDPLPMPLSKPQFVLYAKELTSEFETFADRNRAKAAFFYVKATEQRVTMRHVGEKSPAEGDGEQANWDTFLRQHQLPEFEPFTSDVFELCKVAGVGTIRVFYLQDEKDDFETRIDPLIRATKRSLGDVGAKYCWLSVDMDDPTVKLNCHQFPCIQVVSDTSVAGGTRHVFGDYIEEQWTVDNIKQFFLDIEKGLAEGVQQGMQRTKGPRYTRKDEL
eukprot:TRINITY_DN19794_c0_g4_i2.p1 TRINITY_DN19794_c0_g4~~TRINITY_DN19794_c0_g4_i2.p1  ORF type:complete len:576 (+),score=100.28 TRINITY_DN19794_c0_g4_i2:215-1942(+)